VRKLTSVLSVSALLALTLATAAQPAAASRGQPERAMPIQLIFTTHQFLMDLTFSADGADRCDASAYWFSAYEGRGTATHLGRYTESNTHCMYVTGMTATTMEGTFDKGLSTITAANGDTLTYAYGGSFLVDFAAGLSTIEVEWWEITGGTGRFAHATGSGAGHLVQSLEDNMATGSAEGSIVYDASDRAAH
jgi:hypothetical protein